MMRAIVAFAFCLALLATACYDRPTCSFRCGEDNKCPTEYTCASDGWCKLKGTPDDDDSCGEVPVDAAPPADSDTTD